MELQFERYGLKPQIRMELGSNETIKQGAAAGQGIAVVSAHTLVADGAGEVIASPTTL